VRRVAALAKKLRGAAIVLDHPPLYAADSLRIDRNSWVTPRAMNDALLAGLWEGMTVVKPRLNYQLAVGPDVPVSHRNGFFQSSDDSWDDNDVAIVRFEHDGQQRTHAISFFSQWVPEKYGDVALGQRLSTAAWTFFQRGYSSSAEAGPAAG
jgi:hypothetical protein